MSIDFKKISAAAKAKTDQETQQELNQISAFLPNEEELIKNLSELKTDTLLIQQICTIVYDATLNNLEKNRQLKALDLSVAIFQKLSSFIKMK